MAKLLIGVLISMLFISPSSQTIVGSWKTIDDQTGEAKSIVKIFKAKDGLYYGKITKILYRPKGTPENPTCTKCPKNDYRHNKPIEGLVIISKLKGSKDLKTATGGTVLDPETGKSYDCKLTITDNGKKLKMRGYVGIQSIGRTQVWIRQ